MEMQDKDSKPDIPRIAAGSKDHTTLVAALNGASREEAAATEPVLDGAAVSRDSAGN